MKGVRYTKYTGDLASEMDLEGLLEALSDYLLDSGFAIPTPASATWTTTSTICAKPCAASSSRASFSTKTRSARSTRCRQPVNSTS